MQIYSAEPKRSSDPSVQPLAAYPVKFAPVCKERIWGGQRLKSWYGIQDSRKIGEYWLLSAHPHGVSVVQNGEFKGMNLQDLVAQYPEAYLGRSPQQRFPLLIKLIEAADDLSVQVHPDDPYAEREENDYGKTECWYILDHEPGAEIIYGHRFIDKDHFHQSVHEHTVGDYLERMPVSKDQLVFVPAGTVHAILKGITLLEIQQTSDVTYRIYDWDRVDSEGNGRELHIQQASEVIRFAPEQDRGFQMRNIFRSQFVVHDHLLTCPYFDIERIEMLENGTYSLSLGKEGNPDVLVILEGEGRVEYGEEKESVAFQKGDALLVPGTLANYRIRAIKGAKIIRSFY
jgi:mannose-6-phosphate isomerase